MAMVLIHGADFNDSIHCTNNAINMHLYVYIPFGELPGIKPLFAKIYS
jgi:hypothetical protein